MSHCLFIHDFFQDGRLDVLAEVRELQVCGQWTKEKRALWIKQARTAYEQARRTYPLGSSYNAGRIAGLKSAITARYPTLDSNAPMLFLISGELNRSLCLSCGDEPIWKCHPDGNPHLWVFLCDRCKQEWERDALASVKREAYSQRPSLAPRGSRPVLVLQIRYSVLFILLFGLIDLCATYITWAAIIHEAQFIGLFACYSRPFVRFVHRIEDQHEDATQL